jgi:hypothetical protein
MCTLSFMPRSNGFYLAMNRDEQRTRAKALPPAVHRCGNHRALYPSEPSGGTWIGINDVGIALALINWYSKPQLKAAPAFSRGAIIPRILTADLSGSAEGLIRELPMERLNPFRLIMICLKEQTVREFQSDSVTLLEIPHSWETNHWFSSGLEEPQVEIIRARTCAKMIRDSATDSPQTPKILRNLHRSHAPEKGPYSICMHREDACTVSFTEMIVNNSKAAMSYHDGAPCKEHPRNRINLSLSN